MILEWSSDIKDNGMFRKAGLPRISRNYEVINSVTGETVATASAWEIKATRNPFYHDGRLYFRGHQYHIPYDDPEVCRFDKDWIWLDENDSQVMISRLKFENYTLKKKKLFSKEYYDKKKKIAYQEITLNSRIFRVYNIHMGKDKDSFIFYENDQIVSEILLKDLVALSGRFLTLYNIDDEEILFLTLLYCYYLNLYGWWRTDNQVLTDDDSCGSTSWEKTRDLYEASKFSEEFIEEVKRKANIS